jgi:hypothetical protein
MSTLNTIPFTAAGNLTAAPELRPSSVFKAAEGGLLTVSQFRPMLVRRLPPRVFVCSPINSLALAQTTRPSLRARTARNRLPGSGECWDALGS